MAVQVIVLNGASSAGKTSVTRALQRALPDHWITLGVDHLIFAMPPQLDGAPEGLVLHPDGSIATGEAWAALEAAWRRGIAAMARSGLRIILDEVLLGGAPEQRQWNEALSGLGVVWVAVRCDLADGVAREAARGDRVVGQHANQAAIVHEGVVYDLEVDTSRDPPEVCAAAIAARLGATSASRQGVMSHPG